MTGNGREGDGLNEKFWKIMVNFRNRMKGGPFRYLLKTNLRNSFSTNSRNAKNIDALFILIKLLTYFSDHIFAQVHDIIQVENYISVNYHFIV